MSEQAVHHLEETDSKTDSDQQFTITEKKKEKRMKTIDTTVLAGYNAGIERNRLRAGIVLIEFERTKEILMENLPKSPAVIYDIGGAYGEYAWWLASLGYEVHLFDISETNIKMSEDLKHEYPNVHLKSAEVCDARSIPRKSESADAVLLMGPIYSITEDESPEGKTYFAYNEREKEQFLKELEGQKYTIQRSKGLGENDPDMMNLTTMNPKTRRLIQVNPGDVEQTAAMFDILLGDNLTGRKDYISEHGSEYMDDLDIS